MALYHRRSVPARRSPVIGIALQEKAAIRATMRRHRRNGGADMNRSEIF
jgi:hypothetical protein